MWKQRKFRMVYHTSSIYQQGTFAKPNFGGTKEDWDLEWIEKKLKKTHYKNKIT